MKTGEDYPKNQTKGSIGIKRQYIKKHLHLSNDDNKLIDSYVNILHGEGGHAFTSEKLYFSLTKNIGIELAYFLVSKLEKFLDE